MPTPGHACIRALVGGYAPPAPSGCVLRRGGDPRSCTCTDMTDLKCFDLLTATRPSTLSDR